MSPHAHARRPRRDTRAPALFACTQVVVLSACSTGLLLHGQACATSRLVRPGGLRANVRPAAQLSAILALTLGACAVEWGFTRDAPSAYGLLRGLHAAGDSGADLGSRVRGQKMVPEATKLCRSRLIRTGHT